MKYFSPIVSGLKQPFKALHIISEMFYYSYLAHHRINYSFFRSLYYSFLLYVKDGFFPKESLQYGFLSDNFAYGMQSKYSSRKNMSIIQRSINPQQWELLTEDKSIFYFICKKLSIPIPKMYAIFFKDSPGWNALDKNIRSQSDWIGFLNDFLPDEFVIKPSRGVYGRGIKIFQKNNSLFLDEKGIPFKAIQIYHLMATNQRYNSFVIQERLHNHEVLASLSETDRLQTIRVITACSQNREARILHAYLKPIVGDNFVDNQDYGRTGNLLAEIDIDTGLLKGAIVMGSKPYGIKEIDRHPDTGIKFSGIVIPGWEEVCKLALTAATQFFPIRAIGWDIAKAQEGSFIVEGNIWWDPPKQGNMDRILKALSVR